VDAGIPDHRLALMFACAHPAIAAGIRAPLMLQVVLGARRAYEIAIGLERDPAVRRFLQRRQSALPA
jgi:predicted RNA polymerase sigma factor